MIQVRGRASWYERYAVPSVFFFAQTFAWQNDRRKSHSHPPLHTPQSVFLTSQWRGNLLTVNFTRSSVQFTESGQMCTPVKSPPQSRDKDSIYFLGFLRVTRLCFSWHFYWQVEGTPATLLRQRRGKSDVYTWKVCEETSFRYGWIQEFR